MHALNGFLCTRVASVSQGWLVTFGEGEVRLDLFLSCRGLALADVRLGWGWGLGWLVGGRGMFRANVLLWRFEIELESGRLSYVSSTRFFGRPWCPRNILYFWNFW